MDVTTTQMMWKPPLLRLTQISMPGMVENTTNLYVDPFVISQISRAKPTHTKEDGTKIQGDECTMVNCCHFVCWVIESPEAVARLRDEALGHKSASLKAL